MSESSDGHDGDHGAGDVRLDGPLQLSALQLPPWLARRTVVIAAGATLRADGDEWRDEIVALEAGTVDLVGPAAASVRLGPGAVLWLDGVTPVELRCVGATPVVLVAIRRRGGPTRGDRR